MAIKQWLNYAFLLVLLILATVFSLLKWSDTYSNTHPLRTHFLTEPNKNVLKVDYILRNREFYDSFIFGSSRVGSINPLHIKNGKYYNMTYSEGLPKEHLLNIKLFLEKGIQIKNLLIGLDDFSYKVSFKKHQHQGLTKADYRATHTPYYSYLRELYLRFPLGEDRHHIIKKFKAEKGWYLDVSKQYESYKKVQESFDRKIYETKEHLTSPKFLEPTLYSGDYMQETLQAIKEIVQICKKDNIQCTFFINPIHHTTYKYTDLAQLNKFKEELAKITPYYDFTLPGKITNDNSYWIETSHYTLEVGDMILKRIFDPKDADKDFGKYVPQTKEKKIDAI
jgi:hypothetical protein